MRSYLQRILAQHWRTAAVTDGRAALEAVRRQRPDVLVTDVMMAGMDGMELVAAIRDDERLAATQVVMVSARAGAEAAGDGLAAGADDYLSKPFSSA